METKRERKTRLQFILGWAKRLMAISLLGGKCEVCGNGEIEVLCFHHEDSADKEFIIGNCRSKKWSVSVKEIKKCKLMCHNCHRELHYIEGLGVVVKNELLKLKGSSSCSKCGYDKCTNSLAFHHRSGKEFSLGDVVGKKLSVPIEQLKNELDKCDLLCFNCHAKEHFQVERFLRHEVEIRKKTKTYTEDNRLNWRLISELYEQGLPKKVIARKLGVAPSSVRYALDRIGEGNHTQYLGGRKT